MEAGSNYLYILNKLVGTMDLRAADILKDRIDCFLHPEVSLFIPASGQCEYAITPSHTHPAYSFIYHFQPVEEIIIEGKSRSYDVQEGKCLCVISPGIPHQEVIQDNFQSYIAIMIDSEFFNRVLSQYWQEVPIFRGDEFVPHTALLNTLRCFMLETDANGTGNYELLNNLASAIAHLIARSVLSVIDRSIPLYDRFEIDKAIAYMNSHYSEKITVEILAEQVNRSSGHFAKIFKTVTGSTPMEFLSVLRIQKARNMLISSRKTITEISVESGFNTPSYFSACFFERYKMTPTTYRQNFQQKA